MHRPRNNLNISLWLHICVPKVCTKLILEGAHESAYLRQVLAFNAEKFRGSRDPSHAPFWINFFGVVSGLSLGTLVPNLKSVSLIVFDLLAFIAKKFRGSRDPGHAPFCKNFWGSSPDCPWEDLCQI